MSRWLAVLLLWLLFAGIAAGVLRAVGADADASACIGLVVGLVGLMTLVGVLSRAGRSGPRSHTGR